MRPSTPAYSATHGDMSGVFLGVRGPHSLQRPGTHLLHHLVREHAVQEHLESRRRQVQHAFEHSRLVRFLRTN